MDFASRTLRVIWCVSHGCRGPALLHFLQCGSSAELRNQTVKEMLEKNSTSLGSLESHAELSESWAGMLCKCYG